MKSIAVVLGILLTVCATRAGSESKTSGYVLGAGDILTVRVADLDEFSPQNLPSVRVDDSGEIQLPIVGRVHAAGLTTDQLGASVSNRLLTVMKAPDVVVMLMDVKSHPVSVLGAVKNPGVYQITGKQTLFEVLSLAGGLSQDAGNTVNITREKSAGTLPLTSVRTDLSGKFSVGQVALRSIMQANNPQENVLIQPNDVISVPKADLVYVVGAVKKPGGFVLSEREHMTALQAVSLAEGLDVLAAGKRARILRQEDQGGERKEMTVNLQRVLSGQDRDVELRANDILFVPINAEKSAGLKGLDAAVALLTGLAIYRR